LYQQGEDFAAVYSGIVEQVMALGRRPEGVVYAVPGHPFVAEATCPEIARRARLEGIPLRVVEGLSFLEPTLTAWASIPSPSWLWWMPGACRCSRAAFPDQRARHRGADPLASGGLPHQAGPDEPVSRRASSQTGACRRTSNALVESVPLYEIDRSQHIGLLTALYVPPLGPSSLV